MAKKTEVFRVGSFAVLATSGKRGDGGSYPAVRIEIGKAFTTLDSYEALRLKCQIEEWLKGTLTD